MDNSSGCEQGVKRIVQNLTFMDGAPPAACEKRRAGLRRLRLKIFIAIPEVSAGKTTTHFRHAVDLGPTGRDPVQP